ncbi:MAG: hypothetical protein LEGION0403_FIIPPAGN_00159 [Legionella sp.]|uniref:PIG-L deacetylase family protein n=1 Tax=Legionella sp. TaxID=459 RepID=UPI003D0E52BB
MEKPRYKILLIEPNLKVARSILNWLQDKAEVTHASDIDDCKKQVAIAGWDLVITDMNLPDMDDLDITIMVKNANPETSLLIVTEDKKVDFIISAMQHHADGLFFKPLQEKEFVSKALTLAEESRNRRFKDKKIVLAIGAHPDDVEFGCAGALAKHRADGDSLNILTLSMGEVGGDSSIRMRESQKAAEMQNAQLFMGNFIDTDINHSATTIQFIEKIVQEVQPTHIYTHSFHDSHQDHRSTHQATITACRKIPNLYCYLSPSSTVDFKPNVFINIDKFIEVKLLVLSLFSSQYSIRPYLEPDLIKAIARYWGRFSNYNLVEPMEVIKGHS